MGVVRILWSIILILLLVPGYAGEPRLALWGRAPVVTAERVALDPADPARRRLGGLEYVGGIALRSVDPGFGGYSAMAVAGDRFTLLSDGGLFLRFTMGRDLIPRHHAFGALPDGPGTGWAKIDRDSESMAVDPATGRIWVGFERVNAIVRYAADFARAERIAYPREMRRWPSNSGAETIVRLRSGRFVVMSELKKAGSLLFAGDPVAGARSTWFMYQPPRGFRPTDAAELPDGRLVVLNRSFTARGGFTNRLTLVDPRAIRTGATIRGREIAALVPPLIHDNFEGIAVSREGRDTIVWLVSDDNQSWFQRTLLLKFRLVDEAANSAGPRSPKEAAPGTKTGR